MRARVCVCVCMSGHVRERGVLHILTDNHLEICKVIAPELFKRSVQEAHLLKIITGD